MYDGDLIIFINYLGHTISFTRTDGMWITPNGTRARDEDILTIQKTKKMWIQLRGGYVVALNLKEG